MKIDTSEVFGEDGLPNFRIPLPVEIGLAKEITAKAASYLGSEPSGDERLDLTMVLIHIAAEHTFSILRLFETNSFSSGYALMRPALETSYKAMWIATTATEEQVHKAYKGHDAYGDFKHIIEGLAARHSGTIWQSLLLKIKLAVRTLHENTHTGGAQTVRRLQSSDYQQAEYSFPQLLFQMHAHSPPVSCSRCY